VLCGVYVEHTPVVLLLAQGCSVSTATCTPGCIEVRWQSLPLQVQCALWRCGDKRLDGPHTAHSL